MEYEGHCVPCHFRKVWDRILTAKMGVPTNGNEADRLFDALNHRYRRRLLAALSEKNPQTVDGELDAVPAIDPRVRDDRGEAITDIEIVHVHLPKLANYGYVSWDPEAGQITKGPNWDAVEPLLDLLVTHGDDLRVDVL